MIIYCLTKLELGAVSECHGREAKVVESKKYKLTRLIIGERKRAVVVRQCPKTFQFIETKTIIEYVLKIQRFGEKERRIKMEPKMITINPEKTDWIKNIIVLELMVNASEHHCWITSIVIRNIKNSTETVLTDKQKSNYLKYLLDLERYVAEHLGMTIEDAFRKVRMVREKREDTKFLHQTMRRFCNSINKFCNPETTTLHEEELPQKAVKKATKNLTSVYIDSQSDYFRLKRNNKYEWDMLTFYNIKLIQFGTEWFEAINLTSLRISFVEFSNQSVAAFEEFGMGLKALTCLKEFWLSCGLGEIHDAILENLPVTLLWLDFSYNKISKFPEKIERFSMLENLSLSFNPIPTIPDSIKGCGNLKFLTLCGTNLERLEWGSLNKDIYSLKLGQVKNLKEMQQFEFTNSILEIKSAKLTSIDAIKFSPKIDLLFLNKNLLQHFYYDPQNFLNIGHLDLSNNKLKEFPWHLIASPTLEILNLAHNEIESLGSPIHWYQVAKINLSFNHISQFSMEGCEKMGDEIFNPDFRRVKLNLSHNRITFLPKGFEKITQIENLNIGGNKIEFDETIDEKLWKRIPSSVKKLDISGNSICTLPCSLKNLALEVLNASDCKLCFICPILSQKANPDQMFRLNIAKNDAIKACPFSPREVLPYPKKKENPPTKCQWSKSGVKEQTWHLIKVLVDQSFQNKIRAAERYLNFKFEASEEQPRESCKCCSRCGGKTDNLLVKEVMTMNFEVYEILDKKDSKDKDKENDEGAKVEKEIEEKNDKDLENNSESENDDGEEKQGHETVNVESLEEDESDDDDDDDDEDYETNMWDSGAWKADIQVRLCDSCKTIFKKEAEKVVSAIKRKKKDEKLEMQIKKPCLNTGQEGGDVEMEEEILQPIPQELAENSIHNNHSSQQIPPTFHENSTDNNDNNDNNNTLYMSSQNIPTSNSIFSNDGFQRNANANFNTKNNLITYETYDPHYNQYYSRIANSEPYSEIPQPEAMGSGNAVTYDQQNYNYGQQIVNHPPPQQNAGQFQNYASAENPQNQLISTLPLTHLQNSELHQTDAGGSAFNGQQNYNYGHQIANHLPIHAGQFQNSNFEHIPQTQQPFTIPCNTSYQTANPMEYDNTSMNNQHSYYPGHPISYQHESVNYNHQNSTFDYSPQNYSSGQWQPSSLLNPLQTTTFTQNYCEPELLQTFENYHAPEPQNLDYPFNL